MDLPAAHEDFEILMYDFSSNPESDFVRCLLANLCIFNGSLVLKDHQLTILKDGRAIKKTPNSQKKLLAVLLEYFHLDKPMQTRYNNIK